jgi:hypothetical protein
MGTLAKRGRERGPQVSIHGLTSYKPMNCGWKLGAWGLGANLGGH